MPISVSGISVTGISAGDAGVAYSIAANAVSYSHTVGNVSEAPNWLIAADAVSYSHTTGDVAEALDRVVQAAAVSYAHTAPAATETVSRPMPVDAASYAHTVADVSIAPIFRHLVEAAAVSYSHSAPAVSVLKSLQFTAGEISYSHTVPDVEFSTSTDYAMPADAVSYGHTAADATEAVQRRMAVNAASYAHAAAPVDFTVLNYAANPVSYAWTFYPPQSVGGTTTGLAVHISFCRMGDYSSGTPVQAVRAKTVASEVILANGASQVTAGESPDNTGFVRIFAESGIYVSCGPEPDAVNDPKRLFIPPRMKEILAIRAGDKIAVCQAEGG
jgi:hypothetical protein